MSESLAANREYTLFGYYYQPIYTYIWCILEAFLFWSAQPLDSDVDMCLLLFRKDIWSSANCLSASHPRIRSTANSARDELRTFCMCANDGVWHWCLSNNFTCYLRLDLLMPIHLFWFFFFLVKCLISRWFFVQNRNSKKWRRFEVNWKVGKERFIQFNQYLPYWKHLNLNLSLRLQ